MAVHFEVDGPFSSATENAREGVLGRRFDFFSPLCVQACLKKKKSFLCTNVAAAAFREIHFQLLLGACSPRARAGGGGEDGGARVVYNPLWSRLSLLLKYTLCRRGREGEGALTDGGFLAEQKLQNHHNGTCFKSFSIGPEKTCYPHSLSRGTSPAPSLLMPSSPPPPPSAQHWRRAFLYGRKEVLFIRLAQGSRGFFFPVKEMKAFSICEFYKCS